MRARSNCPNMQRAATVREREGRSLTVAALSKKLIAKLFLIRRAFLTDISVTVPSLHCAVRAEIDII